MIVMCLVSIFIKSMFFHLWSQFLLLALGMKSATSHNSCILCKVHISERYTKSINIMYHYMLQYFSYSKCFSCKQNLADNFITILIHFISKNLSNRSDLSKPLNYFQTVQMRRMIDNTWASQPGCKGQPLFNVPLENVLIDELHLLLRITDRLEHGIILEVIEWDQVFQHVYALVQRFF